jgi:hypothetical protein
MRAHGFLSFRTSIRPVLFGLKDLIRKLELTAVGDTGACGRCNRKDWLSAAAIPREPEAARRK